jgi:hypothetical protein
LWDNLPEPDVVALSRTEEMKTSHLSLIQVGLVLCVSAVPSSGANQGDPHNQRSDDHQETVPADNNGRQIAQAMPIWSGSLPAHPIPMPPTPGSRRVPVLTSEVAPSRGWRKITLTIPDDIGEAVDFSTAQINRLAKFADDGWREASRWLVVFAKQLNAPPTITPSAEVYHSIPARSTLEPVKLDNHPWFMPDGRMKTLIQR